MSKIFTNDPKKFYFSYPNTVAVICVTDGQNNYIMPAVWQIPLSRKPMLYGVLVSPKRFTYEKLMRAEDYSLNYFSLEHAQMITDLGSSTGRDLEKVAHFGLELEQSRNINSPILKDALVSIECKKKNTYTFGDHVLFEGEVAQIAWDGELIKDGRLDINNAEPLLYTGDFTYTTIDNKRNMQCKAYQS